MPTPEEIAATKAEEAEVLNALWDVLGKSFWWTDPSSEELQTWTAADEVPNENATLKKEVEDLKTENKEKDIVNQKLISKKNKWKEKYTQANEKLQQLQNWELDDSYESERDRDMDIVATQSDVTMAKTQMEEAAEEEKEAFFAENPFARENQADVLALAEKHNLETWDAYKLFLANNHPDKLYDVQKMNQKAGGIGMIPGGSSRGAWSTFENMTTDEMEKTLINAHNDGNLAL